MAMHPPDCECDAYGCQLRRKGVQVSHRGMVRHNGKPPAPHRYNQWEKGKAGEDRPGGTRMPYIDKNGSPIPIKKYTEGFHKDKEALKRFQNDNTHR